MGDPTKKNIFRLFFLGFITQNRCLFTFLNTKTLVMLMFHGIYKKELKFT